MKTKIIPFDLEMAKKIQAGEIKGVIKTKCGNEVRILCFDLIDPKDVSFPIVCAVYSDKNVRVLRFTKYGRYNGAINSELDFVLEVPEEAPEEQHPIEESELYQAGYKVGFEAGRCVAFDEKKGCVIKKETPKHKFKVGDKVIVNIPVSQRDFSNDYYHKRVCIIENIDKWGFADVVDYSLDNAHNGHFPLYYLTPYKESNQKFKPFDKVLVRDNEKQVWLPRLFDSHVEQADFWTQDGKSWKMCIPYEGNEHLVDTTDKPKED